MEQRQISRLLSENSMARVCAAQWLRENGSPETAQKLEGVLEADASKSEKRLSKAVLRDVSSVLCQLSQKHITHCSEIRAYVVHRAFSYRSSLKTRLHHWDSPQARVPARVPI